MNPTWYYRLLWYCDVWESPGESIGNILVTVYPGYVTRSHALRVRIWYAFTCVSYSHLLHFHLQYVVTYVPYSHSTHSCVTFHKCYVFTCVTYSHVLHIHMCYTFTYVTYSLMFTYSRNTRCIHAHMLQIHICYIFTCCIIYKMPLVENPIPGNTRW